MMIPMLYSKIHRATVTQADLQYEGSMSIDRHLIELAGLKLYQRIEVYNINNGERFATYVIEAPAHSGIIQVNGAAAHKASKGDLVIIAAYAEFTEDEATTWKPRKVFVDAANQPIPEPVLAGVS
jgi:aspartate 1-decarboxylase